eukprot:1317544-Rhodomonas_salina.4
MLSCLGALQSVLLLLCPCWPRFSSSVMSDSIRGIVDRPSSLLALRAFSRDVNLNGRYEINQLSKRVHGL